MITSIRITATQFAFGPLPDGWLFDQLVIAGAVSDGSSNSALALSAGFLRRGPNLIAGEVAANSRTLLITSATQIFTYTAVALNTAPGPSIHVPLNALMPTSEDELYLGVQFDTVTNFNGVVSAFLRPIDPRWPPSLYRIAR